MKKLMMTMLLGLMLLLTTTSAMAEWTRVDDIDQLILYVDRATIRRSGSFVKMWDLGDFKKMLTVQSYSYFSHKSQQEYDCKEEKKRLLAFTMFDGKMGSENVVSSNGNAKGEWDPIEPKSIGETLWKIACRKR